jgi:hypothetical protein
MKNDTCVKDGGERQRESGRGGAEDEWHGCTQNARLQEHNILSKHAPDFSFFTGKSEMDCLSLPDSAAFLLSLYWHSVSCGPVFSPGRFHNQLSRWYHKQGVNLADNLQSLSSNYEYMMNVSRVSMSHHNVKRSSFERGESWHGNFQYFSFSRDDTNWTGRWAIPTVWIFMRRKKILPLQRFEPRTVQAVA